VAIDYARVQIDAGADSIGMSDAAACLMGRGYYRRHLWPQQMRILGAIRDMGAMARVHMCGCTNALLEDMRGLPADVVELDYMTDIAQARRVLGPHRAICGNVSTVDTLVRGSPDDVRAEAAACHRACGARHVVSPGCEVSPLTPPANIHALVAYAREAGGHARRPA
jgi:uroporphyrinogen-III decarboxylase